MRIGSIALDANLLIFAVLGGFFVLAFLFGEARLKRIALALIAGLFAADQLGSFTSTQLAHLAQGSLELATIKLGILVLVAGALSLGKSPSVGGHFSLRSFMLAALSAAVLIAFTQSYLDFGTQAQVSSDYNLVAIAVNNKSWWLAGLLLWLIILQFWKKKSKEDDDKKGKKKKR